MSNDSGLLETQPDKTEEIQRKKKQVWVITLIMLVSFCVGTMVLLAILWFVFEKILPQGLIY